MSISSILNVNPNQVPWANLSCNTLKCNSITLNNPVTASFPNISENLSINAADNSPTAGITYTLPPTGIFVTATQAIQINDTGKYFVKVNIPQVNLQNIANSYGDITAVLKVDVGGTTNYDEVDEQTQNIPDATTAVSYYLSGVINVTPGSFVQVLFRRTGSGGANGVVILANSATSEIKFVKIL